MQKVKHRFHRHYGIGYIKWFVGDNAFVEWDGVRASSLEPISNLERVDDNA